MKPSLLIVVLVGLLQGLLVMPAAGRDTTTLAIYQFRPENMEAMGFESDVMLAIRNEMENYPGIELLAKRDMEDVLARRDIAQEFSVMSAVEGGRKLSVRYVLVGSVSKQGGRIDASLMLVDVDIGKAVEDWRTSYRTRNEINKAASDLVAEIVAVTKREPARDSMQSIAMDAGSGNVLQELTASAGQSYIAVQWRDTPSDDILGYNVYRSESREGPFSFLGSGDGMRYQDHTAEAGVRYYYQVGEFNLDGTETRSSKIAEAQLLASTASSRISPPLIYTLLPLAGGVSLEFVGSLVEGSEQPARFRIYRAANDRGWERVGEVTATVPRSNTRNKTLKYTYNDTRLNQDADAYRYAVSAVAADGAESARSEVFEYSPPRLMAPESEQQFLLREGRLRWQPARIGEGYRIYRREQGRGWEKVGELAGLSQASYRDGEGLADGVEYEYSYTVFDALSESPRSEPVSISTKPAPPPPAGLTASSGLARQVSLNWDAVRDPDVQTYVIYRAEYSDSSSIDMSAIAVLDAADGESWVDTGEQAPLENGARYAYAVATRNRLGGEGALSLAVAADTKPPPPPVAGVDSAVDGESIVVSWQVGGDDVGGYVVSRRWAGGDWETLGRVSPQQLEYRDELLRPYANVEYRVVAVDSTDLESVPLATDPITSPAAMVVRAGETPLLRRNALSWDAVDLVEGFEVQRRASESERWQRIARIDDGSAVTYEDSEGLKDGQRYTYRVLPLVAGEPLGESNLVDGETKVVSAPDELTASVGAARQITLSWPEADDSDIAGYIVYRARGDAELELQPYAELEGADNTLFVDTGAETDALEHGTQYRYAIAARNIMGGVGPVSSVAIGSSKPVPEPVYNLVAFSEESSIKLDWDYEDIDNVNEFHVFSREADTDSDWQLLARVSSGDTEFKHAELIPYVTVEYRVQVRDVDDLKSRYVHSKPMTSPARIDVQVGDEALLREVELSWNTQYGLDGYVLQRREAGATGWTDIRTLRDGDATSYTDKKGLADGKSYEYQVVAVEGGRRLGNSNQVQADTKPLPEPPADLVAKSGMHASVELSWTPLEDSDVGGYTVYRVRDGELTKLASVSGHDSKSYLDDGGVFSSLEDGADYSYAVAAFNRYRVEGDRSELVTASTKPPPNAVTGVAVAEEDGTVTLSWDASPETDIAHYRVVRSSGTSCSNFKQLARVSAGQTEFRDDKARPDSRYCYRLVAVDGDALESSPSQVVEVVTPAVVAVE